MKKECINLIIGIALFSSPLYAENNAVKTEQVAPRQEIVLTGTNLTIEEIVALARNNAEVRVDPSAWERVAESHALILRAAKEDKAVYGLNRGVGLNKDKTLFKGDVLTDETKAASIAFNRSNLLATSSAAGPQMSTKIVAAVMLIKLNSILQGTTGAQPVVAELLLEFINRGIYPVIPSRGSIGEADITILSHLGLALIGEGNVSFDGRIMSAREALEMNGLKPLVPYGKDSLSIMSSNAYSAALAALVIYDAEKLLDKADAVFALSLEGLNGNVAPYLEEVQNARPFLGQKESAANIRRILEGSSLWQTSQERELQDPLSFRSASQVHGAARDIVRAAKEKLLLHLKSSDDNPIVILNPKAPGSAEQERAYYLNDLSGAVIPTANFETINWVIDFEALGIALSHVSQISTQRMMRLSSEKFTHLTRFLAPDASSIVFGAVQKTFAGLNAEIRTLSAPISPDSFPLAGEIEDHATNAPLVLQRVCKIIDNLYYIFGLEMMHASQAIDLRKNINPDFQLGEVTEELYKDYRTKVAFIDKDRSLSEDIEKSYAFLISCMSKRVTTYDCIFKEDVQP